jgi:hypothetical protein
MPTPQQNSQLRNAEFGYLASRAAAVVPTVAQSPQTIFTVTGRVLVSLLLGEITTVFDGTVYTLKVSHDPTVGGAIDLSAALTMTSFTAGDYVTLGATVGAALTNNNGAIGSVVAPAPKLVLADGILTLTGSATQTGVMKWSLYYVPLDANSNVVAA